MVGHFGWVIKDPVYSTITRGLGARGAPFYCTSSWWVYGLCSIASLLSHQFACTYVLVASRCSIRLSKNLKTPVHGDKKFKNSMDNIGDWYLDAAFPQFSTNSATAFW